jgi:hypothetical protein
MLTKFYAFKEGRFLATWGQRESEDNQAVRRRIHEHAAGRAALPWCQQQRRRSADEPTVHAVPSRIKMPDVRRDRSFPLLGVRGGCATAIAIDRIKDFEASKLHIWIISRDFRWGQAELSRRHGF